MTFEEWWHKEGLLYFGTGTKSDAREIWNYAQAAERIKNQAEIQRLTTLANTAEKWRGIAMSRDGNGRTVQEVWNEAAAAEREACAKVAESAEIPIAIDVWMGTKKSLTAATAIGIADAIRARGKK